VSTFNFLADEKRYVAGAFIPPLKVEVSEDERMLKEKLGDDRSHELDMLKVVDRMAKLKSNKYKQLRDSQNKEDDRMEWF